LLEIELRNMTSSADSDYYIRRKCKVMVSFVAKLKRFTSYLLLLLQNIDKKKEKKIILFLLCERSCGTSLEGFSLKGVDCQVMNLLLVNSNQLKKSS